MAEIRLHDSRSRRKVPLAPLDPENVRMYVCGPTVYDRAHLGNARPVVVFDTLYRLLRHVYGPGHVTYVRNFTDVDDKINAAAQALKAAGDPRSLEALIAARSDETIGWYHDDMDALGALRPTQEPRATAFIAPMIAMIETLIARGHAYAAEGHVLFDVRSFPGYGALSGRSVDDMIAGARVEVAPYKRDPMDFVLWKPSGPDLPGWDSPWGRGRPGWHIECSAMSHELLGPSFDIHGGGIDLQFPHHENEIAQSCCAHPGGGFASIWMHNEMLLVEGKKMSKSLGNFFTVRDLLDQGVPGEVIRFVFLSTHYSKPMDWTERKVRDARKTLARWRTLTAVAKKADKVDHEFLDIIKHDLATPKAFAKLEEMFKLGDGDGLLASARLLGLLTPELGDWFRYGQEETVEDPRLKRLFEKRNVARQAKSWASADGIRDCLALLGVSIQDHKGESAMLSSYDFLAKARSIRAARLKKENKLGELSTLIAQSTQLGLVIEEGDDGRFDFIASEPANWEDILSPEIDAAVEEWCEK